MELIDRWQRGELEALPEDACWSLLAAHNLGRVAYDDDQGPVVTPVNYAVSDGAVLLATSHRAQLAVHAPGSWVALEIDAIDVEERSGWSVLVRGRAEAVEYAELPASNTARPAPWTAGDRTFYLRIAPGSVSGRRLTRP